MRLRAIAALAAAGLMLVLAGCGPEPTVLPGQTAYDVTISGGAFTPDVWRVPGGEDITLRVANRDAARHDFTILLRPVELPYSAEDEANVFFQQSIEARETSTVSFTAPQAPGDYNVISSLPGDAEGGLTGTLVVVQIPSEN